MKADRVTIAHTCLPDEIEKERKKAENASALVKGKMTGGAAIRIDNERIQAYSPCGFHQKMRVSQGNRSDCHASPRGLKPRQRRRRVLNAFVH